MIMATTLSFMVGCNFGNRNGHSIAVTKTSSSYQFKAKFPDRKTTQVLNYIKQTLHEDKLFSNPEQDRDSEINLGDTLRFHLSTAPGKVGLHFNWQDNSPQNCKKLEDLCAGIKSKLI